MVPSRMIEGFQGLVGKVGHVADLNISVIGGRREEHVGDLLRIETGADGRYQAALGSLGVAYLHELPEPTLKYGRIGRRGWEGMNPKPWRHPGAVVRDRRKTMICRPRPLDLI